MRRGWGEMEGGNRGFDGSIGRSAGLCHGCEIFFRSKKRQLIIDYSVLALDMDLGQGGKGPREDAHDVMIAGELREQGCS